MISLIDLIISSINGLLASFGDMIIISGFSLFMLLLFAGIILAIIDVIRRLPRK